jgi:hypothetical protein
MSILETRSDRKLNFTHVGASLPSRVDHYLTLYSLAKKTTKSKIIGKLLDAWIEEQVRKDNNTIYNLLQDITHRSSSKWKLRKAAHAGVSIIKYKNTLAEELISKGLSEEEVYTIISEIK